MGLFKSMRTGLPMLVMSDFSPHNALSGAQKETLRCYVLHVVSGNGYDSTGSPAESGHVRQQLRQRGFDPDDMLSLRNFLIKNGLMYAR